MADGYVKIANLMSNHSELAIFRGFDTLNMQNLLYQQAEITWLEHELKTLMQEDPGTTNSPSRCKDWWSLAHSEDERGKEQWQLALQIQNKLEKYSRIHSLSHQNLSEESQLRKTFCDPAVTSVTRLAYISRLPKPNSYDIEFLRNWLKRPNMGNFPLVGRDRNSWCEQNEKDLIALCARHGNDIFSKWFTDKVVPWFHNVAWKRIKKPLPTEPISEISQYSESHLQTGISILATVAASLLPLISIIVLNFVSAVNARLGIITAFAALFAFFLALLTQGRRVEIFAATSAFAAVQVVFIAGGNGCSC